MLSAISSNAASQKLKQFRRVATRFDKTARNYRAVVTLAAIIYRCDKCPHHLVPGEETNGDRFWRGGNAPYVGTVFRLDGLCAGGLIAIAYRNAAVWGLILERRAILLGILDALIAVTPLYTWFLHSSISLFFLYNFGHTYLALLYGAAIQIRKRGWPRVECDRPRG
jgi:hypothetical protein